MAWFVMYDYYPGERPDDPVEYRKKDRVRNLPKPRPKERQLYSNRRPSEEGRLSSRLIYYEDP